MAACDRDLTKGGPLHAIRLLGQIQSTIVCFVVRLSEVQTDLLDLYGDGCACDSRGTPSIPHHFQLFIFQDKAELFTVLW